MPMKYGCGAFGGSPSYDDNGEHDNDNESLNNTGNESSQSPVNNRNHSRIIGSIILCIGVIGFFAALFVPSIIAGPENQNTFLPISIAVGGMIVSLVIAGVGVILSST